MDELLQTGRDVETDTDRPPPVFEQQPVPVFVDPTGRRSRRARLLGWLLAAVCLGYLTLVAVSMSGSHIGPLLALPPVRQSVLVFPDDDTTAQPGALELPDAPPGAGSTP